MVALIGHSYGAYLSAASAAETDIDALILTGWSGSFAYFDPFISGVALRVARLLDPQRWGHLDSGFLTAADLYAEVYGYFTLGYFERHVAEWSYTVASEPFAVGELPSLLATNIALSQITAPVYVIQGQFDVSACGGNCVGLLANLSSTFSSAKAVEWIDDFPSG